MVEHDLAKVGVASSNLVSRSKVVKAFSNAYDMSHSSSGLGHRPFTAVTGVRTPYGTPPTFFTERISGNSSVGRARPCQGRGREFESRFPLQKSHPSSILVHILEIYLLKSLVVFIGIKMEQVYSS